MSSEGSKPSGEQPPDMAPGPADADPEAAEAEASLMRLAAARAGLAGAPGGRGAAARLPSSNRDIKRAITQLEQLVVDAQEQVTQLQEEQRSAVYRAAALQLLVRAAEGILEAHSIVARGGGGGGSGGGGGGEAAGAGAHEGQGLAALEGQLRELEAQLRAAHCPLQGAAGRGTAGGAGCGCAEHAAAGAARRGAAPPPPPALAALLARPRRWSPVRAAEMLGTLDTSWAGISKTVQSFTQEVAPLVVRVRNAAPDAEHAAALLQAACERVAAWSVATTLEQQARMFDNAMRAVFKPVLPPDGAAAAGPAPAAGGARGPAAGGGAAAGGAAGGAEGAAAGGAPAEPVQGHWRWALQELGLSEVELELLRAILHLWRPRRDAFLARTEELAAVINAAQAGGGHGPGPPAAAAAAGAAAPAPLPAPPAAPGGAPAGAAPPCGDAALLRHLARLEALQLAYGMQLATFHMAVYFDALTDVQVAQMVVLSWPYVPTLQGMDQAVAELDEQERGK